MMLIFLRHDIFFCPLSIHHLSALFSRHDIAMSVPLLMAASTRYYRHFRFCWLSNAHAIS